MAWSRWISRTYGHLNDYRTPGIGKTEERGKERDNPEWVAGLHHIDLARDVIDQEGDTFEFYATYLIAAVVTQIFSYMIDSGVQYGYIYTGEAFCFLYIPKDDPAVVQYFLCILDQDIQVNDKWCLHRIAIGQVLAFTLQALADEAPSQEGCWAAWTKESQRTHILQPKDIGASLTPSFGTHAIF
ncbi:hypothetical protein N7449_011218 [Penicillium cf. viridicatum]|uniref:Uncharacterized protein n=1 Tax=Penicillium cf. viridicatum TaxID=2972119 RepID=A0A9W9IYL9_9EURO|nr:hypothetical protein N7449_011218 [Penicillium cf. viridicatum]